MTGPAEWPDRFIYVTTASQGAAVNHAPLHRADDRRCVGLVVLCPLASPNRPSDQDRTQSLVPADRLIRTVRNVFGVPPDRIHIEKGHTDLLGDWTSALHIAADMARDLDAAVVFNVTAGRKPTVLGALLGAPRGPDAPDIVMISIGLDSTIRRVDLQRDGSLLERPLSGLCDMTLEVYLGTYGLKILPPEGRDRDELFLISCIDACAVLDHGLRRADFRRLLGDLQGRVAEERGRPPFRIALRDKEGAVLQDLLSSVTGASVEGQALILQTEESRGFLSGLWLEVMALLALRRTAAGYPGAQIARGLEVADVKAPPDKVETDFDIALLHRDQFALVECKAGRKPENLRKGITHLSHYRALLSAQAGRAWLLAPLADRAEDEGLKSHAADRGVILLTGPDAVATLVARVEDWLGSALPSRAD